MATSIRQQIMGAFDTRMKAILTANGYETNLGSNVFEWRATPIADDELPALVYRDLSEARDGGFGFTECILDVDIQVFSKTITELRASIADIEKAIFTDERWSTLATMTDFPGGELAIEQAEVMFIASKIMPRIHYRTLTGNPYAQG